MPMRHHRSCPGATQETPTVWLCYRQAMPARHIHHIPLRGPASACADSLGVRGGAAALNVPTADTTLLLRPLVLVA